MPRLGLSYVKRREANQSTLAKWEDRMAKKRAVPLLLIAGKDDPKGGTKMSFYTTLHTTEDACGVLNWAIDHLKDETVESPTRSSMMITGLTKKELELAVFALGSLSVSVMADDVITDERKAIIKSDIDALYDRLEASAREEEIGGTHSPR